MKLGLVLMASGMGRRFGSNKLLTDWAGRAVVSRAMDAYPWTFFQKTVVVSPYAEILALAACRGYRPLPNPYAQEGISASVRLGLGKMTDMDGVLFAVCDQPWLTSESVGRLIAQFNEHPNQICALSWQGTRGNPCLFPSRFYPALLALRGDCGGGAVIRAHSQALLLVEAGSAHELRDIDTPEDLADPPGGS